MSQQGPIIVVARDGRPAFADTLADAAAFPVVESQWMDVQAAVAELQPALIVAEVSDGCTDHLNELARSVAHAQPYVPLIVIGELATPPPNALPFDGSDPTFARLPARANAALRVRTLHATVLRRLDEPDKAASILPETDPLQEATALLVGRGASYPALSIALGEQMGIVGALSIEAGAKHLNIRDIDGVIVGEGFSPRIVDAFLTVLSEDTRFRNLPVIVAGGVAGVKPSYELANLEVVRGGPQQIVGNAAPLIRQQAFESRLNRALKSLEAGGVLDPRTGLLTLEAFEKDFTKAVSDIAERGGGFSAARFSFERADARTSLDAARILGRLMRRMDFATLQPDGSIIAAFAETDLRMANVIVRRLASVLKHTMLSADSKARMDAHVTLATLKANDSAEAVLERLHGISQRAAS
ncbi:GGDEF domain-containing protein [Bradyrhizobium sp. LHD-71]|uniref:GGDEF domain-containing protein n=1 Tax=Bradyrhizobium sp. LHD-71 TaxID=3072141 RepID=UPI00280D81F1|nr:GGDEF domain-containing protein [Bradyrhizobium sp. LHD-71]MDQ8728893.1 GGDEF domain-containing protein [Bradyrhizobium sp. LHD-71]